MEGKLKEQLLTREREIAAVQARMQASYQDHVSETQQLQGKVSPALCSAASSSGCQVAFGGRCVVFWRRLEMCEGTRASGRGETPQCSWTMVLEGEEAHGSILMGCRIPGGCQHQ